MITEWKNSLLFRCFVDKTKLSQRPQAMSQFRNSSEFRHATLQNQLKSSFTIYSLKFEVIWPNSRDFIKSTSIIEDSFPSFWPISDKKNGSISQNHPKFFEAIRPNSQDLIADLFFCFNFDPFYPRKTSEKISHTVVSTKASVPNLKIRELKCHLSISSPFLALMKTYNAVGFCREGEIIFILLFSKEVLYHTTSLREFKVTKECELKRQFHCIKCAAFRLMPEMGLNFFPFD